MNHQITVVGRDKVGTIAVDETGLAYYLTECCGASAKGVSAGTACRACYRLIDPALGGTPNRDLLFENGQIRVVEKPMTLVDVYGDGLPYEEWKEGWAPTK